MEDKAVGVVAADKREPVEEERVAMVAVMAAGLVRRLSLGRRCRLDP